MTLALAALLVAVLALVVALWAALQAAASRNQPRTMVAQLEAMQADQQAAFERLVQSHKRLRSRIGMQELRERQRQDDDEADQADLPLAPPRDVATYKARLRARLGLVPGRPAPLRKDA